MNQWKIPKDVCSCVFKGLFVGRMLKWMVGLSDGHLDHLTVSASYQTEWNFFPVLLLLSICQKLSNHFGRAVQFHQRTTDFPQKKRFFPSLPPLRLSTLFSAWWWDISIPSDMPKGKSENAKKSNEKNRGRQGVQNYHAIRLNPRKHLDNHLGKPV